MPASYLSIRLASALAAMFLLAAPSVAQAPAVTFDSALTICRTAILGDHARGKAMFEALPATSKPVTAVLCLGYEQGVRDTLARGRMA